jgi:uncharacterized Rmd1/YagE family protein
MTKPTDGFKMIDDVLKGLKKTKRQEEWGFQSWPFQQRDPIHAVELLDAGGEYWEDPKTGRLYIDFPEYRRIEIEIILVNDKQEILSTITNRGFLCRYGITKWQHEYWSGNQQNMNIYDLHYGTVKPEITRYLPTFKEIDVNKITDTLTIKILSLDGIDTETAISTGYIKISQGNIIEKTIISSLKDMWEQL